MSDRDLPRWYKYLQENFADYMNALDELGKVVRHQGPLDTRTTHLIQLAAAAAIRSEGAVHSHVRRSLEAGATVEEIYHTIILLTSTIGFPNVSAAMSWAQDILEKEK
jgi:alkylhydroperoxidase/carboxymuconolactone decarboxylase family protein YurZ